MDRSREVIQTDRLSLRRHTLDDYEAALAMWSDPEVTRFIGGKPSTPQQVWMRILNYAGLWALLGYGYWAVIENATQEFIGEAGFANFNRDIEESMRTAPEVGWAFSARVRGRGFATEAVNAVTAWGDNVLTLPRTVCLIASENHASIRVAEKCGFRRFKVASYLGEPTMFFERSRP